MESIEKLRVLLKHWIDHNGGHVEEFEKWRTVMAEDNRDSMVTALTRAMTQMGEVSATLQAALDEIGGPAEGSDHHHHGHGHHHHH